MDTEIRITADGSSTLFVPSLNEHYHSTFGAVQESEHIFIGYGLKCINKERIRILEVGFGTGLNALLTLIRSSASQNIQYDAIEKYPLRWEMVEQLNYASFFHLTEKTSTAFKSMHVSGAGEDVILHDRFLFNKHLGDFLQYAIPAKYDLVYFDAFAPAVHPEMWHAEIFQTLFSSMNPGGILVTYSAKGEVRRRMKEAGFLVNRLPGPPGKREVLQALKT